MDLRTRIDERGGVNGHGKGVGWSAGNGRLGSLVVALGRVRWGRFGNRTGNPIALAGPVTQVVHAATLRTERPVRIAFPRRYPPARRATNFLLHECIIARSVRASQCGGGPAGVRAW